MFDSIGNMPLHPLVLHSVVIGVPLTLLICLLFAFPRTRSWARWPLPVVAVGAAAATFVTRASGSELAERVPLSDQSAVLISQHAQLAGQLLLITIGVAVLGVVNAVVVGRAGRGTGQSAHRVRDLVLVTLLVLAAAVAAFWVYRVGDLGARAVWNPSGTIQYSGSVR